MAPDANNNRNFYLPSHQVYIPDKIYHTGEEQATDTKLQVNTEYVPDSPPRGIRQSRRVRFNPDQLDNKIQRGQTYVSAMEKEDRGDLYNVPIHVSVDKRTFQEV